MWWQKQDINLQVICMNTGTLCIQSYVHIAQQSKLLYKGLGLVWLCSLLFSKPGHSELNQVVYMIMPFKIMYLNSKFTEER